MKNLMLFVILFALSVPAFSQDGEKVLQNKSGINILPEKGDMAIGIDAVPFLNLLNNKGTSPGFNFVNNIPSITLKYFNTDKSALRMTILLGYSSVKNKDDVTDQYNQETGSSIGLKFGYERRMGKSRVQGFYGVDGSVGFDKNKNSNSLDVITLETSGIGFGASFFIGAEVFVAAKLSVGGQFSWGPSYTIEKDIHYKESISTFSLGANNANGALTLAFHF
jgi:hypothetical protein